MEPGARSKAQPAQGRKLPRKLGAILLPEGYRPRLGGVRFGEDALPHLHRAFDAFPLGQGNDNFLRFKDALYDAPGEQKRWYSFREKRLQEALLAWLDANGIKAENPPPWARRGKDAHAQPPLPACQEEARERSKEGPETRLFIDLLEEKHERLGFELDKLLERKLLLDDRPFTLLLPSFLEEEREVLVASEREGVLFVLARALDMRPNRGSGFSSSPNRTRKDATFPLSGTSYTRVRQKKPCGLPPDAEPGRMIHLARCSFTKTAQKQQDPLLVPNSRSGVVWASRS